MPRTWMKVSGVVAILVVFMSPKCVGAGSAGENLLPATTKGFLSITNLSELSSRWHKTQLGQLMDDPAMEPFSQDMRRQAQSRWSGLWDRLGLTLEDLEGVPGGELSVALIEKGPKQSALALLADVTDHQQQAQQLIVKVAARLTSKGAKQSTTTLANTPVLAFDIPNEERNTYYFLQGDLLGACDDPAVVQGILRRHAGSVEETLASVPAFRASMARCQKDLGQQVPQIRWFVEPIAYLELTRASQPEEKKAHTRRGKSMLEMLKSQGFAGVRGIGGFVDVNADRTQLLYRTAVIAPPPFEKSMKMLRFINGSDFTPPSWVPREIASYTMFYGEVLNAFDNIGPLFDELFGEGEKDVWKDTLESLKFDPDGPKIDLRNELFAHLNNQIITLRDYQLPITPDSERLLYAIQAKDEKKVAAALKKAMESDESMRRREFAGYVIWEAKPEEKQKSSHAPVIELGRMKRLAPEEEEEGETPRLLPHQALTVAHGYLMIASHYDFLVKVLRPIDPRESLARDVDYRVVEATSAELGAGQNFLRSFSRSDEEYRSTYELTRQGKMPESQSLFGRMLNRSMAHGNEGGVRKQQIDGSKMPDYDIVRRGLGPAGSFGTAEENGWFFKSYLLPKR